MKVGLRTRVVASVVLVTTSATAIMAYAAYQVQAQDAVDRFTTASSYAVAVDSQPLNTPFASLQAGTAELTGVLDKAAGAMAFSGDHEWMLVAAGPTDDWGIVRPIFDTAVGMRRSAAVLARERTILGQVRTEVLKTPEAPNLTQTAITRDPTSGKSVLVVGVHFTGTPYFLVEFFDISVLDYDLAALRLKLVYIAAAVSVLGVGAALLIARRIRRPILSVAEAAKELGGGALGVRVPIKGRDEVADLARSFNAMAQRLGESIEELRAKDEQQRRFVADVAHDLRTPLSSMVAAVENLEPGNRSAELLQTQTRRLARLVEDLLEIASFDAGKAELRTEPVDLEALVADAREVTGVPATVVRDGDVTVTADPRRIHTIVCNLLSNAFRHGASPITVTLDGTGDEVIVRVADSGPGVPDELLPILFDRFTRGDRARQATDGSGLGLAIARENALVHKGSLTVHNDGGAVFTLTLPR